MLYTKVAESIHSLKRILALDCVNPKQGKGGSRGYEYCVSPNTYNFLCALTISSASS